MRRTANESHMRGRVEMRKEHARMRKERKDRHKAKLRGEENAAQAYASAARRMAKLRGRKEERGGHARSEGDTDVICTLMLSGCMRRR